MTYYNHLSLATRNQQIYYLHKQQENTERITSPINKLLLLKLSLSSNKED